MFPTLVLALALVPTDAPAAALPADWHGRWTGTLKITPVEGKGQEAPMELRIEPIKDSKALRWRIVYGEGKTVPVRNYELVPQEKANHFVIDEKNGVLIDAWLVGNTLHCQFQTADSVIQVRYIRKGETLAFDLAVYSTKEPRTTTTKLPKGEMEVKAHKLQSVQMAELRRAKAD